MAGQRKRTGIGLIDMQIAGITSKTEIRHAKYRVFKHIQVKSNNFRVTLTATALMLLVTAVLGADSSRSTDERISELERKVDLLTRQLEKNTRGNIFAKPADSVHGMGPAASKVYSSDGISIGGYGEALYQSKDGADDVADFVRAVLYLGYKYSDKWLLNTEIEFEHASTDKEGSTSVEFAYLDYLHADELNFRVGLLLIPMGFINELHEPTVFLSARRPDVENRIIPTTWRENGLGFFGDIESISYKAFVVNGLKADGFTPKGLRGGRQKGSEAIANDLAVVARVDWHATTAFLIGGSAYYGNSGQDLSLSVPTEIYEAHAEYRSRGLHLRALGTVANLDDIAELNRILATPDDGSATPIDSEIDSVGEEMGGWYVEMGYDVFTHFDTDECSLTPYVRYEEYSTQEKIPPGFLASGMNDVEVITVGLNFKPLDQIVFKADYQFYDDSASSTGDQFNLAMGYVF